MLNICHLLFSFSFHISYCGYAFSLRTLPKKSTSGTRSKQSPAGIRATKQHQATPSFVGICINRRVSPRASAVSSSASKRCLFSCTRRRTSNWRDVMALKRTSPTLQGASHCKSRRIGPLLSLHRGRDDAAVSKQILCPSHTCLSNSLHMVG